MNVHKQCPALVIQFHHLNDHIPQALARADWTLERRVHTCLHVVLDMIHVLSKIRSKVTPIINHQTEGCKLLSEIAGSTLALRSRLATTTPYTAEDVCAIRNYHTKLCQTLQQLLEHDFRPTVPKETTSTTQRNPDDGSKSP